MNELDKALLTLKKYCDSFEDRCQEGCIFYNKKYDHCMIYDEIPANYDYFVKGAKDNE